MALWAGCSQGGDGSGDASRATGGSAGADAAVEADAANGAAGGSAGANGARLCSIPGWTVHPDLPDGCAGVCVPDDLAAEVPSHVWLARPDICQGCRVLDTPWGKPAHDGLPPVAVSGAVVGYGPDAEYHNVDMVRAADMARPVSCNDTPVAALRIDYQAKCGRLIRRLYLFR